MAAAHAAAPGPAMAPPPLPKGRARPAPRPPPRLPNETLLAVFAELGAPDLLTLRRVSRRFKALAEFLLADVLQAQVVEGARARKLAVAALRELEREKRPRMLHYRCRTRPACYAPADRASLSSVHRCPAHRTFLQPMTFQEINELRFMRDPPHEVRVVCACLSLLYSQPVVLPGQTEEDAVQAAGDWGQVRKVMASRAFRSWLVNLEPGVDEVPLANVRPVEKIIMNDAHISYQNVRRINQPAYKLLIVVAAIIQIVNIQDELRTKRRACQTIESRLSRSSYLLGCIGGPRKPLAPAPDEEDEGKEPPSRADTDATLADPGGAAEPIDLNEDDFAEDEAAAFAYGVGEQAGGEEVDGFADAPEDASMGGPWDEDVEMEAEPAQDAGSSDAGGEGSEMAP
ncbi:hypothetical protein DFJ74DRAFT_338223 [Hyaloraphidium curvatum]|nr:hypothetical protein DFJ74DRAFT_338223 [Hyaloraphidium curvatum]